MSDLLQKVIKPWGTYETIKGSDNYKVKHIVVHPDGKLSLQMHKFRSEHWVIVSGIATVTLGEEIITIEKDESVYIPVQTKHSLENLESEPLELIEVQNGSYLGEDDIFRFEDKYGRQSVIQTPKQ